MSPEEARYAAMRRVKEETCVVWSLAWLEQLVEDMIDSLPARAEFPRII